MIYEPREDSMLLVSCLAAHAKGRCLDMGTGSGVVAAAATEFCDEVIGVDINKNAVAEAKKRHADPKLTFLQSDLFKNVEGTFDTITFNPPYLPRDEDEDDESALTTSGGKKGHEISERFLKQAHAFLNPGGSILLLFSSLTCKEKIDEIIIEEMLDAKEIANEKLHFEELIVYRITKSYVREQLEERNIHSITYFSKGKRGTIHTAVFPEPARYLTSHAQDLSSQYREFKNKKNLKVAIKVQRRDSDALGAVNREADMLKRINQHDIGPRFILAGTDYFIMTFIDGEFVMDAWKKKSRDDLKEDIIDTLQQMRTLDTLGVNKDEMTWPVKHIIITTQGPVVLDFERCKPTEKPHNVTQFCSFLNGSATYVLEKKNIGIDGDELMDLCQEYVQSKYGKEEYLKILHYIKEA